MQSYDFQGIESKWQAAWRSNPKLAFDPQNLDNAFYNLVMFPYPSGSRLHIGHWFNYSGIDIFGRFKKMQGFNVFQPLGYDSFGLPAENFAIKTNIAPQDSTAKNIKIMNEQIDGIGGMFEDKYRMITSSPEYYKWTQWLFLKLHKAGLAFQKEALVNWDPVDQTVIANEQILPDGTAERSGAMVEKKMMKQWFFKITDYAEDLLDFSELNWPAKTITMQKNWIGKSQGTVINFAGENFEIECFTTRIDTVFGVEYVVLAPEHPLLKTIVPESHMDQVSEYQNQTALKSEIDRSSTELEKTGLFTGAYVTNPLNGKKVPVWTADYVIYTYGTGAVMGVPAHDARDFIFANKYKLAISQVIQSDSDLPVLEHGTLINSDKYNGLNTSEAITAISADLKAMNKGELQTTYRLRDWSVGRQRYWGCPIPIVYDPEGQVVPIPEEHLPWELPTDVDYKPTGVPPLGSSKQLQAKVEKIFGPGYRAEFDTLDAFVCSSFYLNRYANHADPSQLATEEQMQKLIPVDLYMGGAEHACMHLLYVRFIHKFLRDQGLFTCNEPVKRLIHQGIITKDGAKMSKSKGNVVNPDDYVNKFGADVFRMYMMFQGPFTEGGDFSDEGIIGVLRFRDKLLRFYENPKELDATKESDYKRELNSLLEKSIKDYENFQFNTVMAACMEFYNFIAKHGAEQNGLESLIQILAPLAPHLAEHAWHELLGKTESIFLSQFQEVDKSALVSNTCVYAIQVNGKMRASLEFDTAAEKESIIANVSQRPEIAKYLEGKEVVKTIFVPGKIVSFVVKG